MPPDDEKKHQIVFDVENQYDVYTLTRYLRGQGAAWTVPIAVRLETKLGYRSAK